MTGAAAADTPTPNRAGETMMEAMRTLHEVLRGAIPASEGARRLDVDETRLAAYQRFVKAHIESVLEKNYTTFKAVIGVDVWRRLVDQFFERYPADDYELNACVRNFPEYVAHLAEEQKHGLGEVHVELVDFEQREFAVYADEVEIPAPDELTAPVINPTINILQVSYPIGSFVSQWRAWEDGRASEPPAVPKESEAETVFVLRHPKSLRHVYVTANDVLLFAFKVVHDDLTVDQAAARARTAVGDVTTALREAKRVGLVILPQRFLPS
ncbi:putative DNA-binding domain-containing protein [Myxococcota bacterium]